MSVIETLISDPHGECRDRVDALTGMLASLYVLACVDTYDELSDFVTRRRLSDVEVGELYTRVEAAEAGPWHLADKETLAAMHLSSGAVILDAQGDSWQQHDDPDDGRVWRITGSSQWWTTRDPLTYGPRFPVTILHNPKKETEK